MEATNTNNQTPEPQPQPEAAVTLTQKSGLDPMRVILLVVGLLAVLIGLVAAYVFLYLGRVEVILQPAANVQLDSGGTRQNVTRTTFFTLPGQKALTVSREGYVKESRPVAVSSGKVTTIELALAAVPKVTQVNDTQAGALTTSTDGRSLLYLAPRGKGQAFYKVSVDSGQQEQISTERLAGITDVKWSPDRAKAILKVKNDASLQGTGSALYRPDLPSGVVTNWIYDFRRYNFVSQEPSQLELSYINTQIGDLAWSPDGTEIAYVFSTASGRRTLNIAKTDFRDFRTVTDIPNAGAQLTWSPDGKTIALYYQNAIRQASEQNAGETVDTNLYLVDVISRKLTKLTEQGSVTGALWAPNAGQLLYSQGNQFELAIFDVATRQSRPLGVRARINQVVWSPDSAHLFTVAEGGELVRLLPGDVKLDMVKLGDNGAAINNLTLTPSGGTLYFTNTTGVGKAELGG